jgi:hypothetical protein
LDANGSAPTKCPFILILSNVGLSFRKPATDVTPIAAAMCVDTIKRKSCCRPYLPAGAEDNHDKPQSGYSVYQPMSKQGTSRVQVRIGTGCAKAFSNM